MTSVSSLSPNPPQTRPAELASCPLPSPDREVNISNLLPNPEAKAIVEPIQRRFNVIDRSLRRHAPGRSSTPGTFYAMWILPFHVETNTVLGNQVSVFEVGHLNPQNGSNGRTALTADSLGRMVDTWPAHIARLRSQVQCALSLFEISPSEARRATDLLTELESIVSLSAKPLLDAMGRFRIGRINTDVVTQAIG